MTRIRKDIADTWSSRPLLIAFMAKQCPQCGGQGCYAGGAGSNLRPTGRRHDFNCNDCAANWTVWTGFGRLVEAIIGGRYLRART